MEDHNKGFGQQGGHLGFRRISTPTCSKSPEIIEFQTVIFHPFTAQSKGPEEQ